MKPVPKRGSTSLVTNSCGLSTWYGYFKNSDFHWGVGLRPSLAGCKWCLASFRNRPDEKEVYEWIKLNYPIVFQSPVRKNQRTGNLWFFIIFDTKKQ